MNPPKLPPEVIQAIQDEYGRTAQENASHFVIHIRVDNYGSPTESRFVSTEIIRKIKIQTGEQI